MKLERKSAAWVTGLALAGCLAAGAVEAGAPGGYRPHGADGGRGGHGGPMMSLLARLDLSEDQKARVKTLREAERPKLAPLTQASMQARRALGESIHAPAFDEQAIRAAAAKLGVAEGDLAVERAQLASRIRGVLTPAQQKQMESLRQQFLDRRQERQDQRHAAWGDEPGDGEEAPDAP